MRRPGKQRERVRGRQIVAAALVTSGVLTIALLGGADRLISGDRVVIVETTVDFGEPLLVTASGRSSKRSWGTEQAEGPPDVKQAGDNAAAWASQTTDGQREWLLCSYAAPLKIRAVMVYETYNPGALIKISAFNAEADEIMAWEGDDPTPRGKPKGVSVIPVKLDFPVQRIRLTIDSPAVPGYNEIDAVGVEDTDGNVHWANRVEASSTFGAASGPIRPANNKRYYSPEQAAGEPDTPGPGDQGSAWASATPDNQAEWLVCEFEKAQSPAEIVVYENNAPGAITKVSVYQKDGKEVTIWQGVDPTPRDQRWGISVFPVKVEFPFQKLKLYINSQEVPGYNEIDAVGLRAANGDIQWASKAEASSSFGAGYPSSMVMTDSGLMVPARSGSDRSLEEIKKELQALRGQVEELQKVRQELKELKDLLKEKIK